MERPSRQEMFMQVAHVVKQRATCTRAQVGCVITNISGTSIVSMGYNGNARGLPDVCDTNVPGSCGCLHAEENALLKAPFGQALVLYTTTSPCLMCAKRIMNSSITTVFFDETYRNTDGFDLLQRHSVIDQLSGMSWWQKQLYTRDQRIKHDAQEQLHAKNIISCLMHDLNPDWKPGENAAARVWAERDIQHIIDSHVIIGPGPVPLSIKVEVR